MTRLLSALVAFGLALALSAPASAGDDAKKKKEAKKGPDTAALFAKLDTNKNGKLSKEEFHDTVMKGRPEKGMPQFSGSKMVSENWEGLYAYLKGRSDGAIQPGHVYPIEQK